MEHFNNFHHFKEWCDENKTLVEKYVKANDVNIRQLDLEVRARNVLILTGVNYISEICFMTVNDFELYPSIRLDDAKNIYRCVKEYFRTHENSIYHYVYDSKALKDSNEVNYVLHEIANDISIMYYYITNVVSINEVGFDRETIEILNGKGITTVYHLLSYYAKINIEEELISKSVDKDVCNKLYRYILNNHTDLIDSIKSIKSAASGFIGEVDCETSTNETEKTYETKDELIKSEVTEEILVDTSFRFDFDDKDVKNKESSVVLDVVEDIASPKTAPAEKESKEYTKYLQYEAVLEEKPSYLNLTIDELDLSTRSYNALRRNSYYKLIDLIKILPERIMTINNLGVNSVNEIIDKVDYFFSSLDICVEDGISEQESNVEEGCDFSFLESDKKTSEANKQDVDEFLENEQLKKLLIECVKENDVPVPNMSLSARAQNSLMKSGIIVLSEIIEAYPDGLKGLRNSGSGTIMELNRKIEDILLNELYFNKIKINSSFVKMLIIRKFTKARFLGLSYSDIRNDIADDVPDETVKSIVGNLLADNEIEYVDFRCYKKYPKFETILNEYISVLKSNQHFVVSRKLAGDTLENIAVSLGITRERVRQILNKSMKSIRRCYFLDTGCNLVDEDYYEYLFTTYETSKELWFDYIKINEETLNYLNIFYTKGHRSIEDALSDSKVDVSLKYKVQAYINRNKIKIDGRLFNKVRSEIEDYVLAKYTNDEMPFEEFVSLFNRVLSENNVIDETLYYTEDLARTRKNRLADSKMCLWKQGEKLRYYNILDRDYDELFDTLNLEGYENIEISTLLFFNKYPDLMEKYDVRDQYELHNLLKKVVDINKYKDMSFKRQPTMRFGEFDRDKAFYDIIAAFSPISSEDLAEFIYSEYGFDKSTVLATYLQPLMIYYNNGYFSVNHKDINPENVDMFISSLTDDFYFFDEIRDKYISMFPNSDPLEINSYTLKKLGFGVYSKYVIKNFDSAEAYYTNLFTSAEIIDLEPLRKRYTTLPAYYSTLLKLREEFKVFVFDGNKLINANRFERMNITKSDFISYCDAVSDFVDENTYFTIHSLRENGFESPLDELGFDDDFYAGILSVRPEFSILKCYGTSILHKGSINSFSKKSFIVATLSEHESIDVDDYMNDLREDYGVNLPSRYEINEAIANTELYFDSIMNKVYSNKNFYYSEFTDDMEE